MKYVKLAICVLCFWGCSENEETTANTKVNSEEQAIYQDIPFSQEYAVKFNLSEGQRSVDLLDVVTDRDKHIQILSNHGLLVPENGHQFYSGTLTGDVAYSSLSSLNIKALERYKEHIVYLSDMYIFSNAWAGSLQITHGLENATLFAAGLDFHFLIYDGEQLSYINKAGKVLESHPAKGIEQILFQKTHSRFILISSEDVIEFIPGKPLKKLYTGREITCAALANKGTEVIVGTSNGYFYLGENKIVNEVPWPHITSINEINGTLWFGTTWGAFKLNDNGRFSYYSGERWLPGNKVKRIVEGPENEILVLTDKGLGSIHSRLMTLEDKAMFYEEQVRKKNIRYGFNCSITDVSAGYDAPNMGSQPSDNLWTAMYLVSQLYRYEVTGEQDAKRNAYEAFEAMERLHTITGIKGLFARSIERDHEIITTKEPGWQKKELLSGSPALLWFSGDDHANWAWRSTASSDQTVGQIFALTSILKLVEDEDWKERALNCLDNLMGYIVDNDFYIIDVDGEPTLWGKWNPDYVNSFPKNVGDRRLYSSNIISFLQTAYQFTKNEKYKKSAYRLINEHNYLENLMRPIEEISPSDQDEISKNLSHEWNHSDDEMYFLAYMDLYQYAFTPALKTDYLKSIKDHWQSERPENNALWNFIYASLGEKDFDLEASIQFLQNYPLDLRNWKMQNSHRNDITLLPENFRLQTTKERLPLSELPLYRHNGNIFDLDRDGDGTKLISAGDTWLLPYWLGRYIGVISEPIENGSTSKKYRF